jgi:PIN domain nuclease of toxin-antitoxin system
LRILTDTHTIFWALSKPQFLSVDAVKALTDADEVLVSVVNLWEMVLKKNKPDAPIVDPIRWWDDLITPQNFTTLPILYEHVRALASLHGHHSDPFDRMLIAQCTTEKLTLVSKDTQMLPYGIPVVW